MILSFSVLRLLENLALVLLGLSAMFFFLRSSGPWTYALLVTIVRGWWKVGILILLFTGYFVQLGL